ncbi:MAG: hypothetical protein J7K23_09895 [Thermoproteales archaeon]|nr:hypothetical protein [Thermoproteales archaeon]
MIIMLRDLSYQKIVRNKEELLNHVKSFKIEPKFSAGIWYFSPAASRFHEKYKEDKTIEERLDIVYRLYDNKVVDGSFRLEAHYPNEINWDNIDIYRSLRKETGIRVLTIVPNLFYDRDFEFGSLSNPYEHVRKKAIGRTIETFKINKELDTNFAIVWPGIDGYENPFEVNFFMMWKRFEEGLAEAMDAVPGTRVAIEPKPYEPRGNNIYRNTADALNMAKRVEKLLKNEENQKLLDKGYILVGLNPEFGHVLMGYEDYPYSLASIMYEGRLAHLHLNSNPAGNYDQDLNVGVLGWQQMYAGLFVLRMYGYREYFGIDINPERMPVEIAIENNIIALKKMIEKINTLDYEEIIEKIDDPKNNRGLIERLIVRNLL